MEGRCVVEIALDSLGTAASLRFIMATLRTDLKWTKPKLIEPEKWMVDQKADEIFRPSLFNFIGIANAKKQLKLTTRIRELSLTTQQL